MKKVITVLMMLLVLGACAAKLPPQNEDQAIAVANLFLKDLAQGNFEHAYNTYLSAETRQAPGATPESFQQEFEALIRRDGKIQRAKFDSHQAVPGRNEIQLYYQVTHAQAGEVLYHFVLSGHSGIGYSILLLDRGNNLPYPEDHELRPPIPRQKKTGVIDVQLY